MVSELAEKAKSIVRDLDPTNSLTFLRLKVGGRSFYFFRLQGISHRQLAKIFLHFETFYSLRYNSND